MIKQQLILIIKTLLEKNELDENISFLEYGGDSLFYARLQIEIKKIFGIKIPIKTLFDNSTILKLNLILERESNKLSVSDLQKTYLFGRKKEMLLGTNSSKGYFSFKTKKLNYVKFEQAIQKLINNQEMLRCNFFDDEYLVFSEDIKYCLDFLDVSKLSTEEKDKEISGKIADLLNVEFDITNKQLINFLIIKLNENENMVFVVHDALVADGRSHQIIIDELENHYYGNKVENHYKFSEYLDYLEKNKETNRENTKLNEVIEEFEGYDLKPDLKRCQRPDKISNPLVKVISRYISKKLYKEVCNYCKKNGITQFSFFLTLFGKSIGRYSNNSKYLINIPVSNRPLDIAGIERLVGPCSDFILFNFDNNTKAGIVEELKANQEKLFNIREKSENLSGLEILRSLKNYRREMEVAPVVFTSTVENINVDERKFIKDISLSHTSQIWLEGIINNSGEGIKFSISYVDELFNINLIEDIADSFMYFLEDTVNNHVLLTRNNMLPVLEKDKYIIDKINDTKNIIDYKSYHEKLNENFKIFKNKIVFADCFESITYGDLEKICGRLSIILKEKCDIYRDDVIGICIPKGIMQAAYQSALAYLGIPFFPLDYDYSNEMMKEVVMKSKIKYVLLDFKKKRDYDQELKDKIVFVDLELNESEDLIQCINKSNHFSRVDIAMLIATSGSTGIPKITTLNWDGIMNCIVSSIDIFGITSNDIAFNITNYSHDMGIFDILGMTYLGGTTIVPNQENYKDPSVWVELLTKYNVTLWISVPAFLEMLLLNKQFDLENAIKNIKTILLGGDYVRTSLIENIWKLNPCSKIFSVGGPTETTMWNIYHEVNSKDIDNGFIPYGVPIYNTEYHILDSNMDICPLGKEGVMFISGIGVVNGYVGGENKEKFIDYNGKKYYDSGDYGEYLPTGEILFVGRKDRQIKVNGERIELDGIENRLNLLKGIKKAVLIYNNNKIKVFYTVFDSASKENIEKILKEKLSDYMFPYILHNIEEFPLNRAGKVDRLLLSEFSINNSKKKKRNFSETEEILLEIFKEVFLEEIDINQDFYSLGGDSVIAMRIIALINQKLGVKLTPYDIFENLTIIDLAIYLDSIRGEN